MLNELSIIFFFILFSISHFMVYFIAKNDGRNQLMKSIMDNKYFEHNSVLYGIRKIPIQGLVYKGGNKDVD